MEDKKVKILVIDDDEIIRGTYADIFRNEGFEVIEAIDGLEGMNKAMEIIPDIIFTGIIMPKMDGFSLKEALAKNVNTANIPVVMLSHMGREEDRQKAESLGVKDFIVQGMVTPRQVVERVRNIFGSLKYHLKFNAEEIDAPKLAKDFYFGEKFQCPSCLGEMILNLEVSNVDKKEFTAKFVCPRCN
ncbi:MAG TPA: response regulator [Candidatus Moranbacteria bacterium]|nr:response regulator [Candidatus Moranbacteria bacterium]